MPPGIGYSFAPGASQDIPMQGQQAPPLSAPDAIRILSLRVPQMGRSPVPLPLLKGAGASGQGGLDAVLAALMGAFSAQPGGGGQSSPHTQGQVVSPTPRITIDKPPNLGGSYGDFIMRSGGQPPLGGNIGGSLGVFQPQGPQGMPQGFDDLITPFF